MEFRRPDGPSSGSSGLAKGRGIAGRSVSSGHTRANESLDKSLVDQCCRAIMLDIETTEVAVGSSERPVIAYAVFER